VKLPKTLRDLFNQESCFFQGNEFGASSLGLIKVTSPESSSPKSPHWNVSSGMIIFIIDYSLCQKLRVLFSHKIIIRLPCSSGLRYFIKVFTSTWGNDPTCQALFLRVVQPPSRQMIKTHTYIYIYIYFLICKLQRLYYVEHLPLLHLDAFSSLC